MSEIKKLLKNRNNRSMLVILIIGITIILFSSMFADKENDKEDTHQLIGEEERLSEILSQIRGAGRVSVMITYKSTEIKSGSVGLGYNEPDKVNKAKGVIVVADGADVAEVRSSLKEAAAAVTGAGANRVCVYDRYEDK